MELDLCDWHSVVPRYYIISCLQCQCEITSRNSSYPLIQCPSVFAGPHFKRPIYPASDFAESRSMEGVWLWQRLFCKCNKLNKVSHKYIMYIVDKLKIGVPQVWKNDCSWPIITDLCTSLDIMVINICPLTLT